MNIAQVVDELGTIKAAIADLEAKERILKDKLTAAGVGAHEGRIFRATVTVSERSTLDMAAVRAKLSPQFIAAHSRVSEVTVVKVVARNGLRLVA
jgi:hypothetical protein